MVEKALYIKSPADVDRVSGDYARVYFGEEFCERKISIGNLKEVLWRVRDKGLAFSYLTPFLTHAYFDTALEAVGTAANSGVKDPEVIINDWGLFHAAHRMKLPCRFVLGRLLNKQKKGPEILSQMKNLNENTIDHFSRANSDGRYFIRFLACNDFSRIEMDNLVCGIRRDNPIPASLYYPFAHVSATRACKLAGCEEHDVPFRPVIRGCRKECDRYEIELDHKMMPMKLYLKGNAHFLRKETLPENLDKLNIDRLVYFPRL